MKKSPLLDKLTLRERIGQTICARQSILAETGEDFFRQNPYGWVWLIGGRGEDFADRVTAFLDNANAFMQIPMSAALDVEGGPAGTVPGCHRITTQTGMAATGDPSVAEALGNVVASETRLFGGRWIWSPVADNPSRNQSVMLTRGYSSDVEICSKFIAAQVKGIQAAGVAATAKHFPGADRDEYRDPHLSATGITQSFDEWMARQGAIFQAAIDAGVDTVMVGHTALPAVDDEVGNGIPVPACLSHKIVTELLKGKMGFEGVVITDDISMRGISAFAEDREEQYVRLYEAGCDVLLGSLDADVIAVVEKLVLAGRISRERIDDACNRVLLLKEKLGMLGERSVCHPEDKARVEAAYREINTAAAPRIIAPCVEDGKLLPLKKDKIKRVLVHYIGDDAPGFEALKVVQEEFAARGAAADLREKPIASFDEVRRIAADYDLVLYFALIGPHRPFGFASFYGDRARQFFFLFGEERDHAIGVGMQSPFVFYDWFAAAANYYNLHGVQPDVLRAFVAGLYGEVKFTGTHPYPLHP